MILTRLKRLNKEEVKPEDVEEAQKELKDRLQAEEDKKKQEIEDLRLQQEELNQQQLLQQQQEE